MQYMTVLNADGSIQAFRTDEDWQSAQHEAEEFIWQSADSKEQAITQHVEKHDQWQQLYS